MRKSMTIGRLAKASGVGIETIRYYQRRGLLATPAKQLGAVRFYTDAMVMQIAFIRRAQLLGFTLEEIRSLLAISDGKSSMSARALAQSKYDELSRRVAELNGMRRKLVACLKKCDANPRGKVSPLIRTLNGDES